MDCSSIAQPLPFIARATDYTEWQLQLSGVHSNMMAHWWWWGCMPSPFRSIYHHKQSREDRYTPPI
jgi:hypothetical protein